MRAIVYDEPGDESVLREAEVAVPRLGDNDVRLRVLATAVNRADLLQRRGLYPPPFGVSEILGLECVGVITELGPKVSALSCGARVMALLAGGGYAEEVVVDAGSVLPVPEAMTDEEAAGFMETFLTAHLNLFVLGQATRGDVVLLHGGGGGVGTAAITLCRRAEVQTMATVGGAQKMALCLAHGANIAIDYKHHDFAERVLEVTDGRGVDIVLDAIGAAYLEKNLACLSPGGRLVMIGLMGGACAKLDLATLLKKRISIIGSTLRSRSRAEKADLVSSFVARFGEDLRAGELRPKLHKVLPLGRAAEAHRLVQQSAHFGKVILRVASS